MKIQVHNFYSNVLEGIKHQVNKVDLEKAKSIISEHPDIRTDYFDSKIKCTNWKISMVNFMLFAIPIPVFSKKKGCFECHK